MKDEFAMGVNYWPIESAMNWWHCFDAGVVKEDFSRIREAGLGVVRIFLLWEDFQPIPNKISVKVLDQLVIVMEIGHAKGLRLIPTFFTGHMSGMNYLPPWMLELKEVGVPSSNVVKEEMVVSEDQAFAYYERLLPKLTNFDFLGVLFWCYGDYAKPLWDQTPFDEKRHERYFGLFREDRSSKPFVPLLKDFKGQKDVKPIETDWIVMEPEDYFRDPLKHLSRLYRIFKERGL